MESNVRRPFFPTAKDIFEEDTDKKVNFEFNNAVKGKPYLNKCQYDDYNASFAIQWLQSNLIFVAKNTQFLLFVPDAECSKKT